MKVIRSIVFLLLSIVSLSATAQFKLYEKGHDSYTSGKYEDAIRNLSEYLTKGTRDKSLDIEAFYLRALAFYKTHNFQNAIPDFEETLLRNHDNTGNIYWFMAKCYEKTQDHDEALNAYNNAIRILGAGAETKAKLLYERSLIHHKTGKLNASYDDLKNASSLHPENTDTREALDKFDMKALAAYKAMEPAEPALASQKKKEEGIKNEASKKESAKDNTAIAKINEVRIENTNKEGVETDKENAADLTQRSQVPGKEPVAKTTHLISQSSAQPSLAEFYKYEKRYALVIGNSTYPKQIGLLKNPVNDATDMAKELEASNFDVQLLTNATYGQIRASLLKFKEKIDAGDREETVALFYYAGHGLQYEDENYLVPLDAAVEYEDDIVRYCFPIQRMVLGNMERSNARMNILILDACRNNPFPSLTRSIGANGLGEMRRAKGSFIAYATAPGSVASDGNGRNGLYTQELLKAMRKPGLTIEQVFKEVRANVLRLSDDKQNTWDSSNIIGEFYFKFQ